MSVFLPSPTLGRKSPASFLPGVGHFPCHDEAKIMLFQPIRMIQACFSLLFLFLLFSPKAFYGFVL